jgi:hypothetical protein
VGQGATPRPLVAKPRLLGYPTSISLRAGGARPASLIANPNVRVVADPRRSGARTAEILAESEAEADAVKQAQRRRVTASGRPFLDAISQAVD